MQKIVYKQPLKAWRTTGLYKSVEACAKAHEVNPVTFRQRLQGRSQSHQIARRKNTKEAQLAAQIAADYAILKQSTVEELRKRAEESSTPAATATAFVQQLQEAAKKVVEEATLLEDTQQEQEDDNGSNLSDEESSDEDIESIGDPWRPIEWDIKRETKL
jgi:hypothetical protein